MARPKHVHYASPMLRALSVRPSVPVAIFLFLFLFAFSVHLHFTSFSPSLSQGRGCTVCRVDEYQGQKFGVQTGPEMVSTRVWQDVHPLQRVCQVQVVSRYPLSFCKTFSVHTTPLSYPGIIQFLSQLILKNVYRSRSICLVNEFRSLLATHIRNGQETQSLHNPS